jgi:hypothetical protein
MLISPEHLREASRRASGEKLEMLKQQERANEAAARLRSQFEAVCITAALKKKTNISFDSRISRVRELGGFTVEELERDPAREAFLSSKIVAVRASLDSKLQILTKHFPELGAGCFPNQSARELWHLVEKCSTRGSAEDVLERLKSHPRIVACLSQAKRFDFLKQCKGLAEDSVLLREAQIKHARVSEVNAAIPSGCSTTLRVSWHSAEAEYGRAEILTAEKLKWISTVWPKWEQHFNSDLVRAASEGHSSHSWTFSSAGYWGDEASFVVDVGAPTEEDVSSMSEEERQIHFYWKEIEERDAKKQAYDEDEGLLIGVHPLPVAEILSVQGFQVKLLQLNDDTCEGEDAEELEISLADLDDCPTELSYRLEARWADR